MNIADMFNAMEQHKPYEQYETHEPCYVDTTQQQNWDHRFVDITNRPSIPMLDGYVSPYTMENWGGTSLFVQQLEEQYNTSNVVDKLDPNKIFNSDISALNAQATDQIRMNKIFENRLRESLTEKGKFGLTETDIMAMQALTAAKSAVINITKEKVAIKKNIADIRLKQQLQNAGGSNNGNPTVLTGKGSTSVTDIGRSIMDEIFNDPSGQRVPDSAYGNYESISVEEAGDLLDENVTGEVNIYTMNENRNPETFVVLGPNGDDAHYETIASDGERLTDALNPESPIVSIDRESGFAKDLLGNQYHIRDN